MSDAALAKLATKFLEDFRKNPEIRREVREGTSTKPKRLQEKRDELEVIYKFVAGSVEQLRDTENPLSPDMQQKSYLTAMLAAQAGMVRGLGLLVDCLSVEIEKNGKRHGKPVKLLRRVSIADVVDESLQEMEEVDLKVVQNMLHDVGLILNPDAFRLVDGNGVVLAKDKYVPTEKEATAMADQIADDADGVTTEEREKIRQSTIDTLFGARNNGF